MAYLGSDEEIPSLDEMSADIPSRLTDDLHSNVVPIISSIRPMDEGDTETLGMGRGKGGREKGDVPRHPRNFLPINAILKRFIQITKFHNSFITVILASPDWSIRSIGVCVVFVNEDVLGSIPSSVT